MKKKNIIALLAMLLTMSLSAVAQTEEKVDNYTVDFNDIQITEDYGENLPDDWTPKSGWDHIVKSSFHGNYKGYSASKESYFTSPVLRIGYEYNAEYDPMNSGDYLVTPKLQGTIAMKLAGNTYRYGIAVRKAEKNADGTYNLGDTIYTNGDAYTQFNGAAGTITRDAWSEVSFTVDDATYLAICAYGLYVDDFTATSAWITKEKKVALTSVKRTAPEGTSVDADAEGNFNVSFDVELTNSGDFDLSAGEGQLKLVNANDTSIVYAEKPFPGMETGETSEPQTLSATIHTDDYQPISFLIKETLSGKTADGGTITPVEFIAKPVLKDGSTTLTSESLIDFGTTQKEASRTFNIQNDGGADYTITDVTVPEGFSTTLKPQTIAAHKDINFTVTKNAGKAGTFDGNVVIKGNANDITLHVKGTTIDADTWYVNFEDNKMPANMESQRKGTNYWTVTSVPYSLYLANNNYMANITNSDTVDLYTPRLIVAAGEKLSFEAAKTTASESSLDILYSTDRKNWTLAKSINTENDSTETTDKFTDDSEGSWTKYYKFKTFTVDNIPAGEIYLAFRGHEAELDNISGFKLADVKTEFLIRSADIPAEAEVNAAYTAKVTVKNNTLYDAEAGSYNVKLSFGGDDEFAVADGPAIKAGETADIVLTATPHEAGTKAAFATVEAGADKVSSETVNVVVSSESSDAAVIVGNEANATGDSDIPYNAATTSEGEAVYTAEDLAAAGITKGAKIGSISFTGAITDNWQASSLEITIGNSEQGTYSSDDATERTVTDKQTIHTGEYSYSKAGSYSSWSGTAEWADIMNFKLAEPFTYNGGSIVLHFKNINVQDPWYSYVYFKSDKAFKNHIITRTVDSYSEGTLADQTYTVRDNLPITGFGVIRSADVISGTVNDEAGNALEGTQIKLTSGNVEYSATSDAEGKYSVSVIKTDLKYEFFAVKAGYEPELIPDSVFKLEEGETTRNLTLKKATGLFIKSASVPATGTVNSPVVATVIVLNPLTEEVSDYKVQFVIDGEDAKDAADIKALPSLGTATYTISSTPHKTGNVQANFVAIYNNVATGADNKYTINVADEQFTSTVQVLDSTTTTSTGPLANAYKSETQAIYSADQIGLPANAKITKLYYRGYTDSSYAGDIDRTVNVKVWLDNTDVDPANYRYTGYDEVAFNTASEAPVYEGTLQLTKVGSSSNPIVLLEIPVANGFTYAGKSLRVTVYQETSSTAGYIYWIDNNNPQIFERTCYTQDMEINERSWSRDYSTPVVWLEAVNSATITGKVTNSKGEAIEGATVTASKGDVVYKATTDANGEYTLTVSHFDANAFNIIVAAEKYESDTTAVAVSAGDAIDHDVVLKDSVNTGINEIIANEKTTAKGVYTISGQYLGRKVDVNALRPGIYIIDGKKFVVK